MLAILHEMIKSCEGVALDLFGERKEGYLRSWMGNFETLLVQKIKRMTIVNFVDRGASFAD